MVGVLVFATYEARIIFFSASALQHHVKLGNWCVDLFDVDRGVGQGGKEADSVGRIAAKPLNRERKPIPRIYLQHLKQEADFEAQFPLVTKLLLLQRSGSITHDFRLERLLPMPLEH